MVSIPYDVKTNNMTSPPPDVSFSGANFPGSATINPVTGVIEGGTYPSIGSGTATITATGSGGSDTITWPWSIVEPNAIPSSALFASGSLGDSNSYTLNGGDISALVNQTTGSNMVQATAAAQPTLTTFSGASVMQFGNGEVLEFTLPDSNLFHVTMRIVFDQANNGTINPMVAGGNSTFVGMMDDGSTDGVHQNAGSPTIRLNGSVVTPASRDAWHDLVYPGSTTTQTVTFLNINPAANSQWTDDAVWFFGYKAVDSFSPFYKGLGICLFTDSAQVVAAEDYVESIDQGI